jgi:hypothetical protein
MSDAMMMVLRFMHNSCAWLPERILNSPEAHCSANSGNGGFTGEFLSAVTTGRENLPMKGYSFSMVHCKGC